MELKVNLKTILLFSAFFILAGMILGFYSCSANNSPTTPAVNDQPTPITVNNGPAGVPVPVPVTTGTVVGEDGEIGTYIGGYTFTIDADGTVTVSPWKEGAASYGPFPGPNMGIDDFMIDVGLNLVFGEFTQVGDNWAGDITLTNGSENNVSINPRLIWLKYSATGFGDTQKSFLDDPGLVSLDGFCTLRQTGDLFRFSDINAFPFLFIADEDENYILGPGEEAAHQVVIEPDANGDLIYLVFFSCEIAHQVDPEIPFDPGAIVTGIPHNADIQLTEDPELPTSEITVRLEMDYCDAGRLAVVRSLEDGWSTTVGYTGVELGWQVLSGTIEAKPSVDGPMDLLIILLPAPLPGTLTTNTQVLPSYVESFVYTAHFE